MKGRVLVVDDDPALAEMLGIVLRGEGFEPSFVNDGSAALAAFRREKPDVVLLDLRHAVPEQRGLREVVVEAGTAAPDLGRLQRFRMALEALFAAIGTGLPWLLSTLSWSRYFDAKVSARAGVCIVP